MCGDQSKAYKYSLEAEFWHFHGYWRHPCCSSSISVQRRLLGCFWEVFPTWTASHCSNYHYFLWNCLPSTVNNTILSPFPPLRSEAAQPDLASQEDIVPQSIQETKDRSKDIGCTTSANITPFLASTFTTVYTLLCPCLCPSLLYVAFNFRSSIPLSKTCWGPVMGESSPAGWLPRAIWWSAIGDGTLD